jgi:hypothetical protein
MNCKAVATEDFVALGALKESEKFNLIKDVSAFRAFDFTRGPLQILEFLDYGRLCVLICQPKSAALS